MSVLTKNIKKNATKQINALLDAATSINFVNGQDYADHVKNDATANDVREYIASRYDSIKIVVSYRDEDGANLCAEIHHGSSRYNHFVLRFDTAEQLERIYSRAAACGLTVAGACELSLWKSGKCLGGNEDLSKVEYMLDQYEQSIAALAVTPEMQQAAEFVSKRVEQDVLEIFANLSDDVKTDAQLIFQFNPLMGRMINLGMSHKEAATIVKAAVNAVGARFNMPPLFKNLSI